jgi:aspartate aminotransferase
MNYSENNEISNFFSKKFIELSKMGGDIRRIFMLGQKLKLNNPDIDLIDLSLGNPDLEPPIQINNLLIHLLSSYEKGCHRYMDSAGLEDARTFLAAELTKSEKVKISSNSVYLTVGAAGAIQILLRAFLDKDDEVIIFSPYFPEYIPYAENFGAKPIIVKCDDTHQPIIQDFEKKITNKTKVVIMNSPNNPSGIAYSRETLESIISVLMKRKEKNGQVIQLLSDEPYSRVIYKEEKITPLLSLYRNTWLVRSFSKDLGLAGERIGYIAWRNDPAFAEAQNAFRNSSRVLGFVSAPRLMQRLIPMIYNTKIDVKIYEKRVESFVKILRTGGIDVKLPDAGFFVFPKTPIVNDRKFCEDLVNIGVLCVPGSAFGSPGYFRASLTQEQDKVELAAHRIIEFTKSNNYI